MSSANLVVRERAGTWAYLRTLGVLLLIAGLSACAARQAYRDGRLLIAEGKPEPGLERLREATQLEPRNVEYRIGYLSSRATVVNQWVSEAEALQRKGKLTEAEKAYQRVLVLDPENAMAQRGLRELVSDRRHRQIVTEAEATFQKDGLAAAEPLREKMRQVLVEDPQNREALNLQQRLDEAASKTDQTPEGKLADIYRKPVTLEFRDAPIKSVFDAISKVSSLNFFLDKDIRPDLKATVLAKNVAIKDAVRLVLVTNQLEQRVLNENSILIYPNTPQKLKDYQTLGIRTFYLANADVKAVSNTIKSLVKTQDLVVDERLGLLMMRDTPEAIRIAEKLVELQDLADPEVMLEVEVLEIKRSRLTELGIQWPDQVSLAPITAAGQPLTVRQLRNLDADTIGATVGSVAVKAHKQDQDANILANPRIRVRNKDKAQVLIGDRVPVITTTSTSTGFVSESVSYVDVGLKLEVEPNVYLDEEVAIKVNLEVSNLVREVVSKSGTLSYQIGTRSASTVLRLKDGETQVLAGLINDEERASGDKIPGLGEIPILGRLFGSRRNNAERSEIVLSIRPHIVRAIRRPALVAAEFDSGTQSAIGASSLSFMPMSTEGGENAKPSAGDKAMEYKSQPPAAAMGDRSASVAAAKTADDIATVPLLDDKVSKPMRIDPSAPTFTWEAPQQVRVGEQFTAVLRVASQHPLSGLPLLIGFDPQILQVASVMEGDFLKQGGATTTFNQRVDAAQGRIFVTSLRHPYAGKNSGINGSGSVVMVNFVALKPVTPTDVRLLSVTPEPAGIGTVAVPVGRSIAVVK